MRQATIFLLLALQSMLVFGMTQEERREFLDAIRPVAEHKAGQPVRFKVRRLNRAEGWAVLEGELMAEEGKVIDWEKADDCDPQLDKLLWVVAKKEAAGWKVKEISICSPEPPYWGYMYGTPKDTARAFSRPCAIYAGLEEPGVAPIEKRCLAYQAKKRRAKP